MEFRRFFIPGGTYFFTAVTYNRRPLFTEASAINALKNAFTYTMQRHPFSIVAYAILPDHLHYIWILPPGDSNYSMRWRLIKSHFTRHWGKDIERSQNISRAVKGEKDVWQSRFWEHLIRNEKDLNQYIEYIHYNPIKHQYVDFPEQWLQSSFNDYVGNGFYPKEWGRNNSIWGGMDNME